jgi:TonB family protein
MPRKSCLLFACIFLIHLSARADDIKDALSQKYKKQVLALRAPVSSGTQKFDSTGQSLNASPKGKWWLYGGIYIEKLNLSSDTLSLEGPMVSFNGEKLGRPTAIPFGKPVHVEIHLDQPVKSANEAEIIMNRVFFLEGDNTEKSKPEYRRADDSISGEQIYKVGDGVKPPRATYTPEPEFSEKARKAKFQGMVILNVVVDKTGRIARVGLERGLGYELDENAMKRIEDWRFDPAIKDGQPVAVAMKIEVSFHLY